MGLRVLVLPGLLALALGAGAVQMQGQAGGPPSGVGQQEDGPGGPQGPPPHDHGRGHGQDHDRNGPGGPDDPHGLHGSDGPPPGSTMRGGSQLGPPGRWWDDPEFAGSLHLRPDQQTRMDAIFNQNKSALQARYSSLKDQERQLESLTRGTNIDEKALFTRIDQATQARAELEKANAHMLLLLRHELTADQVNLLDARRPSPR